MRRSLAIAIPLLLAVPVLVGLALTARGVPPQVGPASIGAAGWVLALVLRAPVGLCCVRITGSPERAQRWVLASSGPLEESTRLAVLLLVGRDLPTALWVGFGWATIEVLYAIANGLALAALAERTDPQAERARAMLPPDALSQAGPLWGVVERAWASALHIGFTLVLAAVPLLVVASAGLHTLINVAVLSLARRSSMLVAQAAGVGIAAAVLLLGLRLAGAA